MPLRQHAAARIAGLNARQVYVVTRIYLPRRVRVYPNPGPYGRLSYCAFGITITVTVNGGIGIDSELLNPSIGFPCSAKPSGGFVFP